MTDQSDLKRLETMPVKDLRAYWKLVKGEAPAAGLSVTLMRKTLIYHLQADSYGGLSQKTKRKLQRLGERLARDPKAPVMEDAGPMPGTRLVRDWHGTRYHVEVTSDGYLYQGNFYRSLSEIARLITGAHWSGPRFFGLKKRARP